MRITPLLALAALALAAPSLASAQDKGATMEPGKDGGMVVKIPMAIGEGGFFGRGGGGATDSTKKADSTAKKADSTAKKADSTASKAKQKAGNGGGMTMSFPMGGFTMGGDGSVAPTKTDSTAKK